MGSLYFSYVPLCLMLLQPSEVIQNAKPDCR